MIRMLLATIMLSMVVANFTGCGGNDNPPPTFTAQILSDPAVDGNIEHVGAELFVVTAGMSPTAQGVLAGFNPTEFRAFLHFPLRGVGGVPGNATIASAVLDIFVNSIPTNGSIPLRIELVSFAPPLQGSDFDRRFKPPLAFTTVTPPIIQSQIGRHVSMDVKSLMVEAQRRKLAEFQVRILHDPEQSGGGVVEIGDTTGANRGALAPLLQISYF